MTTELVFCIVSWVLAISAFGSYWIFYSLRKRRNQEYLVDIQRRYEAEWERRHFCGGATGPTGCTGYAGYAGYTGYTYFYSGPTGPAQHDGIGPKETNGCWR
jgi:hypothetical protein